MALTFDVLQPELNAKRLGIILVSSGSWKSSKPNIMEDVTKLRRDHWAMGLLNSGYTVFVVRHGSGPRFQVPEMIEDIRRSVRFIRLHASDYSINPDQIGITSGSSGGHLSLMVALTADDGHADSKDSVEQVSSRVQAIVSWFPPTDLINWGSTDGYKMIQQVRPTLFEEIFGTITDLQTQLKSVSPIYHISADDPPLLLIHGDADKTVPVQQSHIMLAAYESAGLPVKLVVHPGGPHTYWPGIEKNYVDVNDWFEGHLK